MIPGLSLNKIIKKDRLILILILEEKIMWCLVEIRDNIPPI